MTSDLSGGAAATAPGDPPVASTLGTMFGRDTLYMAASSLQLLAGVVVTPVVTRVLGLHEYGVFAADVALLYVLYYTANLGLNVGIQRLYAQPDGARKSRNLLAASLVLVGCVTTVVYLTGPLWSPHLGFGDFPLSTRLTVVWSGLFAMTWICLALLRCNERLLVFTTVCLLQSIVGIGLGTVVAYARLHLVTEVLWCAVAVQVVAVGLSLVTVPPDWHGLFDVGTVASTLRFSLPVVPVQLATFVMSAADRIIIQRDLGPGPTGRYQVAYTLGAVGISLLTFLNLAWLPRIFAITDRRTRGVVLAESRDGLYELLVPVILGMALGGPLALRIWAPPSFRTESLVPIVLLVVVATIPVCAAFVHSRLILAEGRSTLVAGVTVAAALVNVVANVVLVPRIGINGSAIATLVAYSVLALGMAGTSRFLLPLARPPLWLWAQLGGATGLTLASRYLPEHGSALGVRLVGIVVCAAWAFRTLRRLQVA